MKPARSASLTQSAIPVLKSAMDKKSLIPVLNNVLVSVRDGQSFATVTNFEHHITMPIDTGTAPGLYVIIGTELVLTRVPVANFPLIPSWYSEPFLTVPVSILKASLSFVSKEESRYTLNAVLLRVPAGDTPITVSATDGHRLRIQQIVNPGGLPVGDYLIPRRTVEILARNCKGDVYFKFLPAIPGERDERGKRGEDQKAELRIVTPTFGMYSRVVSGQFPNYEAVMPRTFPHHAVVLQSSLLAAIKTVQPFCDERSGLVNMAFTDATLSLTANGSGYSKSVAVLCTLLETPVAFDGLRFLSDPAHAFGVLMPMRGSANIKSGMEIGVNALYLQDMIKDGTTGDVYFGWKDGNHAFGVSAHNLIHGATEVGPVTVPEPEPEVEEPEVEVAEEQVETEVAA